MPANLTRQFIQARERYQAATDPHDQLDALQEMLREIPKHKGTDHLQADLKRKIKEARAELANERHHRKGGPSYHVEKGRHPQVVAVGAPNAGKSALVEALTGVELVSAPYPFTTREPHPAMMPFENARVQLVDMPPISLEHIAASRRNQGGRTSLRSVRPEALARDVCVCQALTLRILACREDSPLQ